NNQFTDNLSWFILVGLAVTAVMQVYCLNTALKLHDSVLVVPMFYGFYTAMGLVNTMIYLDEISTYPLWALLLVTFGIGSLVYGVLLL
ncbi:908_t:CDS:2, partial [Funneliformis mosseae]